MSHWTDRVFNSYKSDAKPQPLGHEVERGKRDFELDALVSELADANPAVRKRAARAIGLLGDRSGVAPLIKALGDADQGVRATAADALNAFTLDAAQRKKVDGLLSRAAAAR
jgi:HEAT repeat protein